MDSIPNKDQGRCLADFKDILIDQSGLDDFYLMTKKWDAVKTNGVAPGISPLGIKSKVLKSRTVRNVMDEIHAEGTMSELKLKETVMKILDEIGYERKFSVIRWMGLLLIKLLKRSCSGLFVNESSIDRLKSRMMSQPVVFAPTHRSYADFILLSYICFYYDMEMPVIAAGIDFQSMWCMGRMLRDCSAFFMRRSFGEDKLYWAIFSEYVLRLITDGNYPVEFFIEGTRSRSGKSLRPKFGFLTMVLEPFFRNEIPDTVVVPINISYDRILEEVLFAYEHLGVPKPPESTSGLLKGLKVLNEKYGNIFIDFGEPVSVKEFLASTEGNLRASMVSQPRTAVSEDVFEAIQDFGYHIIQKQQSLAVLSTFNLIAAVASCIIVVSPDPVSIALMKDEVHWLRRILNFFGALSDSKDVEEALPIHQNLVSVTPEECLQIVDFHARFRRPDVESVRANGLSEEAMRLAAPSITLQQYVNPCLCYVINPAIIVVIMGSYGQDASVNYGTLFPKFCWMRRILSYEFVFVEKESDQDFQKGLLDLEQLGVIDKCKTDSSSWTFGTNKKLKRFLIDLLRPFLPGYLALCHVICRDAGTVPVTSKNIVKAAQKKVEESFLNGHQIHPYSLSLDMLTCAFNALVANRFVTRIKESEVPMYMGTADLPSLLFGLGKVTDVVGQRIWKSYLDEEPNEGPGKLPSKL